MYELEACLLRTQHNISSAPCTMYILTVVSSAGSTKTIALSLACKAIHSFALVYSKFVGCIMARLQGST